MLKKSKCCLPTLSGKALTIGSVLTCTAMLLMTSSASAQSQCGASITPTVDAPPGTVFAVGQEVEIDVVFGPTSTPSSNTGYQRISQVTVQMDCESAQDCPCVDAGSHLGFVLGSVSTG